MHQYRSISPIIWIRLSAFFFCLLFVAGAGLVAFTVYVVLHGTQEMMIRLLNAIGAFVLCWVLYLYTSLMCKCPLCRSGPMTPKRCAKHRDARKFLGSYRLRVAATVLTINRFRCPYCGESTLCRVKKKIDQ
jgi:predicted RNA-binding Zn-ribbon protein involved in translation (DUF1610 family)